MKKKAELQYEISVVRQQQINPTDFNVSINQNVNTYRNYLRTKEKALEKKIITINKTIKNLRKRISHLENVQWRYQVDYYIHMEAVLKEMKKRFNHHEMTYLDFQKKKIEDLNNQQLPSLEPLPTSPSTPPPPPQPI